MYRFPCNSLYLLFSLRLCRLLVSIQSFSWINNLRYFYEEVDHILFCTYTVHEYLLYWCVGFFNVLTSTLFYVIFRSGLIAYRIWASIHSLAPRKNGGRGLMPVLMAVVESGGLYASALLALLTTYLSGSNGQFAALDVVTPIVVCYSCVINNGFIIIKTSHFAKLRELSSV